LPYGIDAGLALTPILSQRERGRFSGSCSGSALAGIIGA
jgi:hypothetical protein